MADVIITYETLFDILRKEKSRPELQQLPSDFYGQVVAYMRRKQADVDAAGGFAAPAAQKALIQHRNVQKILRELYERRERKLFEMAINRARTESNLVDTTAILGEEKRFFEDASLLLSRTKAELLAPVLRGEAPEGVVVPALPEKAEGEDEPRPERHALPAAPVVDTDAVARADSFTVRFIGSVPKFLGLKGEVYGPYEPGETAALPGKIAAVLLKKKRVEAAQ